MLLVAPDKTPVTLSELKDWCDVEHDDDDRMLARLLLSATTHTESVIQQSLVRRKLRQYFDDFNCLKLQLGPVQNIDQIQYIDGDGANQTVSTSIYEKDPQKDEVNLAFGQTWPSHRNQKNAVWVDYWAGYFDESESPVKITDTIPDDIKTAIMMLARHNYDNPSSSTGLRLAENMAYSSMINKYRCWL